MPQVLSDHKGWFKLAQSLQKDQSYSAKTALFALKGCLKAALFALKMIWLK